MNRGNGNGNVAGSRTRIAIALAVLVPVLAAGAAGGVAAESEDAGGACQLESSAECKGAQLTLKDLGEADLRGADLRAANLNGSWAHSASFAGADLRDADLRATTLVAANMRSASIDGANLADSNLEFAEVSDSQLEDAYLCRTRLPGGELSKRDCDRPGPQLAAPRNARISRAAADSAPAPAFSSGAASLGAKKAKKKRGATATAAQTKLKRAKKAVHVATIGPGSVVSDKGGLRCPGKCAAVYRKGSRVTLVASSEPFGRFTGWAGACEGSRNHCTLRVGHAKRVTANFAGSGSSSNPVTAAPPNDPSTSLINPLVCTFPPSQDTDGDGAPDCVEILGWDLAVTTPQQLSGSGNPVTRHVTSDPANPDTDGDGVNDGDEFRFNADPRKTDSDDDGLVDELELITLKSLPNHADTDGDSLPKGGGPRDPRLFDGNETTDLETSPRLADTDGDGLTDFTEVVDERTNPRIADLPVAALVAVPGLSNPRFDLDYTVQETSGTQKQSATSTQGTTSSEQSSGTSYSKTNMSQQAWTQGGSCTIGGPQVAGCTYSGSYTRTEGHATTRGSTTGQANTNSTTNAASQVIATSAQRQTTLAPYGCMQVPLRLTNSGPVAVSLGNLQVLALTPDRADSSSAQLLTTLLPINGQVDETNCPATAPDFGPVELPPGGSADVVFAQQVGSQELLDYMAEPTPINYELGAITMTGTNLDGSQVDFLGDIATKALDRTASVETTFPDGTIYNFEVATGTRFDANGNATGVTLGDALGPALSNLDPQYSPPTLTSGSKVSSLRNPETGEIVASGNGGDEGFWNLTGDGAGVGNPQANWQDVVLRPGNVVALEWIRDEDDDKLTDAFEAEVGTDPNNKDTDSDAATDAGNMHSSDYFEARVGWTVPFPRGNQPGYQSFPSPLACDADGDQSPDGPGTGNLQYGMCPTLTPNVTFGPESTRFTDPTLGDTNSDGILDGDEPLPAALQAIPIGGRMPELVREWGGEGEMGDAQPIGLAVDINQPVFDSNGQAAPQTSYVIARRPASHTDNIYAFEGNPRVGAPSRVLGDIDPPANFFPDPTVKAAATGIAVAPGSVGGPNANPPVAAGSPVVVNYYPKTMPNTGAQYSSAFTTFNSSTQDLAASGEQLSGAYPGPDCSNCFVAPVFGPGPETIGSGFLDVASQHSIVIGHGRNQDAAFNAGDIKAIPTRYFGAGDPDADLGARYGSKPPVPVAPTEGELTNPTGVAVDRANNKLYAADDIAPTGTTAGALTRFNLVSGAPEEFAYANDATLAGLRGLAVDPQGKYVYAASAQCETVYKFSPSLGILGAIGGADCLGGNPTDLFEQPSDVDVDPANGIWVTDAESKTMRFFFYPFGPD